jgi:GMP synthase (glutamine-hydrolysing)
MPDTIAVLDFGSQYTQLIARRVREVKVYSELFPWDAPQEQVMALHPKGFILSGGPASAYAPGAPTIPDYVLNSGLPILGICYGMQAMTYALGGKVVPSGEREYGLATVQTIFDNPLLPSSQKYPVWMSHGDRIEVPPPGFVTLATSDNSPIAAIGNFNQKWYGLQFHPEVRHTRGGTEIIRRFVVDICVSRLEWTPEAIIAQIVEKVRQQVGNERVLSAVSGGVDSSVATALVHQAIGDRLSAIFVDTGLLRAAERQQVESAFQRNLNLKLTSIDTTQKVLQALKGVTDPEQKRRIIGESFIRTFEAQALKSGSPPYLVQGTIYPDVVESSAPDRAKGDRIKTHHNVGGLPRQMNFKLVEPLRYLFKDEVRAIGLALGLPAELVWRQPFPGPGLAVRCLGEVTEERLAHLRAADAILTEELSMAGLLHVRINADGDVEGSSQAFVVLLPVRSVGVMGDQRTYQEAAAIRAVTTEDFMTADWSHLPYPILARISNRIVNEVPGINRVVYDITSKPPATIEWE